MGTNSYNAAELEPLILFADNHLLAVNKPAGMLTQDSGTGLPNLEDWAREWVRLDKNKEGKVFLNAVHRIDKAVSGVVLFARTGKALARLNETSASTTAKRSTTRWLKASPKSRPPSWSTGSRTNTIAPRFVERATRVHSAPCCATGPSGRLET
jgi:23S rRNA-/tRNA-specific pseudouridylate synthase